MHRNAETRSANFFKNGGSSNVEVLPSPQSEACYKKQPVKIGGIPIYPYLLHDRTTFMSALPAIALLRHIKRTNAPILQIFFETDYACGDSGQPATGLSEVWF